ncbi:MAG: enoyl-CoA hydratase/isomerase family protein [Desulfomonilia bacterium]
MKAEYLLLAVDARVATVTINRPDKGNSLAPEVLEEIEEMFSDLAAREDVNVIVLTGGEKYFSAGFDLTVIRKLEKVSNEAYTALFQEGLPFDPVLQPACHLRSGRACHCRWFRSDPDV